MANYHANKAFNCFGDGGAANGQPAYGSQLDQVAASLNHLAAFNRRVLFNQTVPDSWIPTPASTADPMFRYRYNNNWDQDRYLVHRVLAVNIAAPAATPGYFSTNGSGSYTDCNVTEQTSDGATATEQEDVSEKQVWRGPETITDTYVTDYCSSFQDARVFAVSIYGRRFENPTDLVVSTDDGVAQPNQFPSGTHVEDSPLTPLRNAIAAHWMDNRRVFAAWSAWRPDTITVRTITTTSTHATGQNLMADTTVNARTTSTPGALCPIARASRANPGFATANVEATVAVYASIANVATTGEVRFISSANTVAITGINTTAMAWYTATGLNLRSGLSTDISTPSISGAYTGLEKVDIFGRTNNASYAVRVGAWAIIEDPT